MRDQNTLTSLVEKNKKRKITNLNAEVKVGQFLRFVKALINDFGNEIIVEIIIFKYLKYAKFMNTYSQNFSSTSTILPNPHTFVYKHTRIHYTYSCICGLPDQLYDEDTNTCPPTGRALRKIDTWSYQWIKYSSNTNSILYIQILSESQLL
ncbi:hypothetical protein C2G38_2170987 [Gigaspora rosea]|uniref:Uncharacterized protein n=1 Tax=Gigaspora rosea TaxID=44941 RepID=A0A397VQK9_9GLOM|nr:hypothetical protein C2G38_2170987 [Gigaspora rosea]